MNTRPISVRSTLLASRSFVLAALRALHLDPDRRSTGHKPGRRRERDLGKQRIFLFSGILNTNKCPKWRGLVLLPVTAAQPGPRPRKTTRSMNIIHNPGLTFGAPRPARVSSWSGDSAAKHGSLVDRHALPGPAAAKPKPNLRKLAALSILAFVVAIALGAPHPGSALADNGGTGDLCNLANVNVVINAIKKQTFYVYDVACSGKPLGSFGGAETVKYHVTGNWDPQTHTATDTVFNGIEAVFDTWTCSDDPWLTAASIPNDSGGGSNGHTCQLKSHSGGQDWKTDTNPSRWFGDVMCVNDPWGASLAGCWSNDSMGPAGPSAFILNAWMVAQAPRG
jgi:hypothetical protein